jgi:hypothetical protein
MLCRVAFTLPKNPMDTRLLRLLLYKCHTRLYCITKRSKPAQTKDKAMWNLSDKDLEALKKTLEEAQIIVKD